MSYKQHTTDNFGTETGTVILVVPSLTLEGDAMVATIHTTDNTPAVVPTPPSGFTLQAPGSMPITGAGAVSDQATWIYLHEATAADETGAGTDTYTWTFTQTEEQAGVMILLDPGEWGEFATNVLTGTGTTINSPTVTTSVDDEVVFHCADKDNPIVFSGVPSGDATVINLGYGPTGDAGSATGIIRTEYPTASTATGTKGWTLATNERQGYTFSIRPTAVATWEQEGYRWRTDDDNEADASWLLAQDTSPLERNAGITTRLRMLLDATLDPDTVPVTIQFKRDDEAASEWRDI
jgi:hypothetical protein